MEMDQIGSYGLTKKMLVHWYLLNCSSVLITCSSTNWDDFTYVKSRHIEELYGNIIMYSI